MGSKQGKAMPKIKIREIIRLRELGYSQVDIANGCNIARSTAQDYLKLISEAELTLTEAASLSDSELSSRLGLGRQKKGTELSGVDFARIQQELTRPGVTLKLLWEENEAAHRFGYSTFARYFRRWRKASKATLRISYKAGEKLFVDYAGLTIAIRDRDTGTVSDAQIFVSCLGASDLIYCEATLSQELCHWIGSHERALRYYGGAPAALIPDNLKSGVTKAFWYEPDVNRTYQDFAEYYQIAVLPTRSRTPRDKGKVEKAVQEVERWILAPLRDRIFYSVAELNAAIRPLLEALNNRVMRDYAVSRQELFEKNEKQSLKPLPEQPYIFASWKRAKVNLDYHVEFEHHRYSVPYWLIHREVELKVTEQMVEIFFDSKRVALHRKNSIINGFSTVPDHMPPHHAAVKSWSADNFIAWADSIGQETTIQVKLLLSSRLHSEQAFRSILGLQRLCDKFGQQRMEAACRRANHFNLLGCKSICSILEKSQDRIPLGTETPPVPCQHENLRGDDYYH